VTSFQERVTRTGALVRRGEGETRRIFDPLFPNDQ